MLLVEEDFDVFAVSAGVIVACRFSVAKRFE